MSLEPRISFPNATKHAVNSACRIRGSFRQTPLARKAPGATTQTKMRTPGEIARGAGAGTSGGRGIEALKQLWQRENLPPFLASLVLRNMILALLRAKQAEKARELLTLGVEAYPGYADLHFLSAVLWLYKQKVTKAFAELEFAIKTGDTTYIGSGGRRILPVVVAAGHDLRRHGRGKAGDHVLRGWADAPPGFRAVGRGDFAAVIFLFRPNSFRCRCANWRGGSRRIWFRCSISACGTARLMRRGAC